MIHVFFVVGMFGSTIEYILRSISNELAPVEGKVLADGSMHSYRKQAHFYNIDSIEDFFSLNADADISTPIYPFADNKLVEILSVFQKYVKPDDLCILIHAPDMRATELNMLFRYHKVSAGSNFKLGLDIFCGNNSHNIVAWDSSYTHWSQMKPWQLREWMSLFYPAWIEEWIESQHQVGSDFLKITNTDVLFNTVGTVQKVFEHCNLTPTHELSSFVQQWQKAQQYIVDEFNLLDRIVSTAIDNVQCSWEPINIVAEAIVQQRLRALGYEIRCDGLDTFPTDSTTLHNLLEKI